MVGLDFMNLKVLKVYVVVTLDNFAFMALQVFLLFKWLLAFSNVYNAVKVLIASAFLFLHELNCRAKTILLLLLSFAKCIIVLFFFHFCVC